MMTQVKVENRTYDIPDVWLAGFCQAQKCSVEVAVLWWDWQERIDTAGQWIDAPESITRAMVAS